MRFKKTIISSILFLAYSVGFAHNLLPHCHHSDVKHEIVSDHSTDHHHEHHAHSELATSDHEHVLHENHYDNNILDLLICVLQETDHSLIEELFEHSLPTINNTNWVTVSFCSTLTRVCLMDNEEETSIPRTSQFHFTYTPPPLSLSPHRGPPSTSC